MTDRINNFENKINAQAEILNQQSNKIDQGQENLTVFQTIMSSFVRSQVATLPSNSVISITTFLPEWAPKKWEKNSACQYNGKPYKCVTAHDSTSNPSWNPTVRSLFVPYHATAPEYALPYDQPTMAEDAYNTDEYMIWTGGTVRKCLKDATVNGPDVLPDSWETVEY